MTFLFNLYPKYFDVYFNVPFNQKNEFKSEGGRWDPELKKWYIRHYISYFNQIDKNVQDCSDLTKENIHKFIRCKGRYEFAGIINWERMCYNITGIEKGIYKHFDVIYPFENLSDTLTWDEDGNETIEYEFINGKMTLRCANCNKYITLYEKDYEDGQELCENDELCLNCKKI